MRVLFGYTIFEILIVLVVIAIVLAFAVPSFIGYLETNRLIGNGEKLYYFLQNARSEAIKNNSVVFITFQAGSNWCSGISKTVGCTCSSGGSCELGSIRAPSGQNLSLSSSGLINNQFSYEPQHGLANTAATVTLTNAQGITLSIKIKRLGNPLLCSTQLTGYASC